MPQTNFSRAPFHMRYSRKSDFEPKFVSIGPYYYNKRKSFNRMENIKTEFTSYFLRKLPFDKSDPSIDDLVYELKVFELEDRIRRWYGERINLRTDDLFRMLVRDSCFLIRIILSLSREENESLFFLGVDIKKLRFDLLLLENQIPYFFMKRVYDFLREQQMLPNDSPSCSIHRDYSTQKNSGETSSDVLSTSSCLSDWFKRKDPDQSKANDSSLSDMSLEEKTKLNINLDQCFTDLKPLHMKQMARPNLLSAMSSLRQWVESKDPKYQSKVNGSSQSSSRSRSSNSNYYLDHFVRELKPFICLDMPWEFDKHHIPINEPDHLLDLYWKWCLPSDLDRDTYLRNHRDNTSDIDRQKSWVKIHLRRNADKRIPNGCELYEKAGVTFVKRKHEKGFGVEFHKGILQLPHLKLDQSQTTLLVNLIAFEDFKPSKDRVVTSYILLLDGLINTKKDVELLQKHGIIHNKLSSIQKASTFFNDIGNICLVDYEDHYCQGRFKDLNNYYKSSWNRQFAKLWHTSFSSPWAIISLLVGALLLILAALQTAYTIASYYKQT